VRALARAAALLLVLAIGASAADGDDDVRRLIDWRLRYWQLHVDTGWPEGLTFELARRQEFTDRLVLSGLEEVMLSGRIAFRLDLDAAAFAAPASLGDFDDGVIVRRARIHASGEFLLGVATDYDFEMSIEGERVFLNEFYLSWNPNRFGVDTITLGHTTPPMGLENLESSRSLVFMEMGSPSMALAPGYRTGLMLNGVHDPWHLAWATGVFTSGQTQATGDASKALAQLVGRGAWYGGDVATAKLVHLGLSMSGLFSGQSDIEYQSRPESFKAPFVVDTSSIDARSAVQYGLEAAWAHGSRLVQAELLQSFVTDTARGDQNFWGAYLYGSWFLTGEHRAYETDAGMFRRATPNRRFHFRQPGWGAFEAAARISYLDLTSGPIRGGKMLNGTIGLNWYWNPELRFLFNYIVTSAGDGPERGVGNIVQARIEIGI